MNNLPPGQSSIDSIRYQQNLQQLDIALAMSKKMIGSSDTSSSDSDPEDEDPEDEDPEELDQWLEMAVKEYERK